MVEAMLKKGTFENSTVFITGAATGLGLSIAKALLALDANILMCGRREEQLRIVEEELDTQFPGKILGVPADVRDFGALSHVLKKGIEKFGTVNALVNNAAGNFISPTERLSHRAFDAIIDIVLKGGSYSSLLMGKYWINEKIPGNILNIVTTYAWTGSGFVVPSAVSKAGMLALTRSLAVEWGKYGIRCNAVAPGPFPTKGAWNRLFPKPVQRMLDPEKRIPLARVGKHEELANLASFLLSDFSAYINGEVITIDGGEWLKGAGEFNALDDVPTEMWDEIEAAIRKSKQK